ncbi:hypothetical protein M407DRAFT_12918, partial [Tulasnella calospora MUT 4182]
RWDELQSRRTAQKRPKTVLRDFGFGSSDFNDWKSSGQVPSGDDNRPEPWSSPNPLSPKQSENTEHSNLPHNTAFMPLQEDPGEDNLDPWSKVFSCGIPSLGSLNLDLCQDAVGFYSRLASPATAHSFLEAVPGVNAAAEGQFTEVLDAGSGPTDLASTIEQRTVTSSQRASRAIRKDRTYAQKGQKFSHVEIPQLSADRKALYKRQNDQQPYQISQSAIRSGYLINSNSRREDGATDDYSGVAGSSEENSSNYDPDRDDNTEGSTSQRSSHNVPRRAKQVKTKESYRKRKRVKACSAIEGGTNKTSKRGSDKHAPPHWSTPAPPGPQASGSVPSGPTPAQRNSSVEPQPNPFLAAANASWMGTCTLGRTNAEAKKAKEEDQLRKRIKTSKSQRGAVRVPS